MRTLSSAWASVRGDSGVVEAPRVHRVASQGQGRGGAVEGREPLAVLEEAEALEDLLGSAMARHHDQDFSASAAGAAPHVLAEGASLEGWPNRGGVALALAPSPMKLENGSNVGEAEATNLEPSVRH
jgi:hypothetical protein